ncbi:MAG: ATP-binding protein [Hyphomicrobiales bacterium]|nr:ATP-binding protein [Hyphomicrobiales bacterium]
MDPRILATLTRIADSLERLRPQGPPDDAEMRARFADADAFVWSPNHGRFQPVPHVNRVPLDLLQGVENQRDTLFANTWQFAQGLPANNALLWGARGMGKSSLVKAVHAAVNEKIGAGKTSASDVAQTAPPPPAHPSRLKLIEIHREDIATLPDCLHCLLAARPRRFIVFCDDLSFDEGDSSYKSLKAVLEGGVEGRPENVLFYATSNRRHLLPRDMAENERATALNPGETVEEKVSLSDRFGLWIGFHNCSQGDYLAMIRAYARHFGLRTPADQLDGEALAWAMGRGARSGRVAWQFIQDMRGREGARLG